MDSVQWSSVDRTGTSLILMSRVSDGSLKTRSAVSPPFLVRFRNVVCGTVDRSVMKASQRNAKAYGKFFIICVLIPKKSNIAIKRSVFEF